MDVSRKLERGKTNVRKLPKVLYLVNSPDNNYTNRCRDIAFQLELRFNSFKVDVADSAECLLEQLKGLPSFENYFVQSNDEGSSSASDCLFLFQDFEENRNLIRHLSVEKGCYVIGPPALEEFCAKRSLNQLISLSRKCHPRFSLILKSYSFVISRNTLSAVPLPDKDYNQMVNRIRWLGGLVRDELRPDRKNQLLITPSARGYKYNRALTLDINVLVTASVDALWQQRSNPKFSLDTNFKQTYKLLPFQDCVLYFHGFPEDELMAMNQRTQNFTGTVSYTIEDPELTHVVIEKPYDTVMIDYIRTAYPLPTRQFKVVQAEWFWETVKAGVRALEDAHKVPIEPTTASCDSLDNLDSSSRDSYNLNKSKSQNRLQEGGISRERLLSQIAQESRETDESHDSHNLILPGYSQKKKISLTKSTMSTSAFNSKHGTPLSQAGNIHQTSLIYDKSTDAVNTSSTFEQESDRINTTDATLIRKADSWPVLDSEDFELTRQLTPTNLGELQRMEFSTMSSPRPPRRKSQSSLKSQSSREKSLDDLSQPAKRKIDERVTEDNSDPLTSSTSMTLPTSRDTKISRKYTIINGSGHAEECSSSPVQPGIVDVDKDGIYRVLSPDEVKEREIAKQHDPNQYMNTPVLNRKESQRSKASYDMPKLENIKVPESYKKSKRYLIIEELFSVEKSYLANLAFLIKEFKLPLEESARTSITSASSNFENFNDASSLFQEPDHDATSVVSVSYQNQYGEVFVPPNAPILPLCEVRAIFGQVDKIYETHVGLYEDLHEFMLNWDDENGVGKIIGKYVRKFKKVYPPYMDYYEEIKGNLSLCIEKYPRFMAHVQLAERKRRDKCKLMDLMIQPVQRLMRYPLIFQRLKSATEKECSMSHPDNQCLEEITKMLTSVSSDMNESKRRTESYTQLFQISKEIDRFPPQLVSSSRSLIQKVDCYQRSSVARKKVTLFILNDYIIVCLRQRTHVYNLAAHIKGEGRKQYSFMEMINMHEIRTVLICNDENQSSPGKNSTARFMSATSTDISSSSNMQNRRTQESENIYGIGFVYGDPKVDRFDISWYSINSASLWKSSQAPKTTTTKGFGVPRPLVNGKVCSKNYDYINAIKDVIVENVCKCKGRMTSEEIVRSMQVDEVLTLIYGTDTNSQGMLTPHESISDLSMISETGSMHARFDGLESNLENRTPSPTLSFQSTGLRMVKSSDRRMSFGPTKRGINNKAKQVFNSIRKTLGSSTLTRNISFARSPRSNERGMIKQKSSSNFITPDKPLPLRNTKSGQPRSITRTSIFTTESRVRSKSQQSNDPRQNPTLPRATTLVSVPHSCVIHVTKTTPESKSSNSTHKFLAPNSVSIDNGISMQSYASPLSHCSTTTCLNTRSIHKQSPSINFQHVPIENQTSCTSGDNQSFKNCEPTDSKYIYSQYQTLV